MISSSVPRASEDTGDFGNEPLQLIVNVFSIWGMRETASDRLCHCLVQLRAQANGKRWTINTAFHFDHNTPQTMKPFDSDSIPIMKYVDQLNAFPFPSNKVGGLTTFEVVLFYDVFTSDDKSNVLVVTIYWLDDR